VAFAVGQFNLGKLEVAVVWASVTKTRSWKLIVVTDKDVVASHKQTV